ncbi:MAG: LacI family DNA-binding transcriptional regulator [Verrucomicrobiota bacterium]
MEDAMPEPAQRKGPVVSLRHVAEAAGVSRMTVSRAFKPEASVEPGLRARVLAVAKSLGYEPDRMVTELMTSFVKRRPVKYRETFAALWWPERWENLRNNARGFGAAIRRGIDAGVQRHGCGVEHLVLSARVNVRTLMRMLEARGIGGLLITPPPAADTVAPALDWRRFCAVSIGTSLRSPRSHRAQVSHYTDMVHVLETLRRRGYRRACLLLNEDLEERMHRAYGAAFQMWQTDGAERIWRAASPARPGLSAWLKKMRPDVVIADTDVWRLSVPEPWAGEAFVSLAVEYADGEVTGNHQNFARVAESAVDLLMQARLRHETGEPAEPLIMLTTGRWIEGRTLRGRSTSPRSRAEDEPDQV